MKEGGEVVSYRIRVGAGLNSVGSGLQLGVNEESTCVVNAEFRPETKVEGMYRLRVLVEGEEIAGSPIEIMLKKSVD